jgi:prolyl-tRNA editing enzyme YbaK/EbsC (Cys-tRNA(Pro) deacylase)
MSWRISENSKGGRPDLRKQALSPKDLEMYMQDKNIPGEIIHLEVPTPTVEAAAQAVGTQPEQIVKSILFLIADDPALTITCGQSYVERRALAAVYGVGRKKVKLAKPEAVLEQTGFEVGAMPPFGHHEPLPTWMDKRVLQQAEVFAGGGAENALVRLATEDILTATQARVIDLLTPPGSNPDRGD